MRGILNCGTVLSGKMISFCMSEISAMGEIASLEVLHKKLNGRKVLIKGNHDRLGDEWYRFVFEDVVNEMLMFSCLYSRN